MTSVVFTLDLSDNTDNALEIDLEEFSDYCVTHELDFLNEFKKRVWNWMVYSSSEGFDVDFDPRVWACNLEVSPVVGTVKIDMNHGEKDGGWHKLAKELEGLADYGTFVSWDDDGNQRLESYLAYVDYDGWRWEEITFKAIRERMTDFQGVYSDKEDVVEELIEAGILDPVPSWVIHNEKDSADEAESMGYFSSYPLGWRIAVWT